jgi:hypothetical protein
MVSAVSMASRDCSADTLTLVEAAGDEVLSALQVDVALLQRKLEDIRAELEECGTRNRALAASSAPYLRAEFAPNRLLMEHFCDEMEAKR